MNSKDADAIIDNGSEPKIKETSVKKKRPGKSSRKRTSEAFREKVGTRVQNERRNKIFEKYGLLDADAAELQRSLESMSLTVQSYAVPLTVSTRGVGFAATIEYSRMITTWNLIAIVEICTIHQYYRVCLYLIFYRLFETRSACGEIQSYPLRNDFYFSEEVRQVLTAVSQVPVATSTVLGGVGKIEGTTTWHSYLPEIDGSDPVSNALFLSPLNIREVLNRVNAEGTPLAFREQFQRMCAVPGVHWSGDHRILNTDDVWPMDYSTDMLRADVHAFMNLLVRVSGRLPRSFISSYPSGGTAAKSGLVSLYPAQMCVESQFRTVTAARTVSRRKKGPDGAPIETTCEVPPSTSYLGSSIVNGSMVYEVWSPDSGVDGLELSVGAAALLGECHGPTSTARLPINRKRGAHVSPGTVLMMLVDAPRPRT